MHKKERKKKYLIVTVVLTLVMGLALPVSWGQTPKYGGILKILYFAAPRAQFGYNTERNPTSLVFTQHALETMIQVDEYGNPTPWLVSTWEIAPDGLSVKLTLQEGVKFHDGSDFNAEALVWNINRCVENGGAYHEAWKSGEVVDSKTVKLNLKYYTNGLLLSMARITIASPTAFKKNGEKWANANPVGTGPFKFVEYKKNELIKYEKNPDYWQKGLPYVDGIEYRFIPDVMTRKAAFENGEAHIVYEMKNELRVDLEKKGYKTPANPAYSGECQVLFMDSNHPDTPFAKLKVRQAISMAIDREGIAMARGVGFWTPTTQFALKTDGYYVPDWPDSKATYNSEKAKKLLSEAGYPNGFKTKLYPHPTGFDRDAVVFMQQLLAQIGIKADIDFLDTPSFSMLRDKGWHNGILMALFPASPNFGNSVRHFMSEGHTYNDTIAIPGEYQQALDASLESRKLDDALFMKVNRLALENAIAIPIVFSPPGPQSAWVPELHDYGMYREFEWIFNSSEKAWLDR